LSDGLDILLALGVWVAPLALAWFLIVKDSQRPGPAHSSKAPSSFGQPHSAGALREEVEQHDMLGACPLLLDAGHAVPAAHAPRRGEFGVEEDGAFNPNRLENAGQGIHGVEEQQRRGRRQQDRTAAQHSRRRADARQG